MPISIFACVIWGFILLPGLSYILAKIRYVSGISEILKHAGVVRGILLVSEAIGLGIKMITVCL